MTFAQDIEAAANGEAIETVVITGESSYCFRTDEYYAKLGETPDPRAINPRLHDIPLTWDMARHLFDYEYDDGFGSQDCHDIYAWSKSYVLYVHEYDGSTRVCSLPRNPPEAKMLLTTQK